VAKLLPAKEGVNLDFNARDGQMPLSRAAWNRHEAVVRLLLTKKGVDPLGMEVRDGGHLGR
jgi:ankyrin repeat protein